MCFSPEASFAGGAVILTIGIATVKQVKKTPETLFAIIPIFFGIQQIVEGFVWLSLQNPEFHFLRNFSSTIFLITALVFWPVMIPISVLLIEENKKIKKRLRIFIVVGISLSLYYTFCLMFFDVEAQIVQYHIQYNNNFPKSLAKVAFVIYLMATITPLFISSIKKMHYFGGLLFFSCLITVFYFTQYLTSVWCFFAALISIVIYLIVRDTNKVSVYDEIIEQNAVRIENGDNTKL